MEPGSRGLESNHPSPACGHRAQSQVYRMAHWALRGAEQPWGAGEGLLKGCRSLLPWHTREKRFELGFQDNVMGTETCGIGWGHQKHDGKNPTLGSNGGEEGEDFEK